MRKDQHLALTVLSLRSEDRGSGGGGVGWSGGWRGWGGGRGVGVRGIIDFHTAREMSLKTLKTKTHV